MLVILLAIPVSMSVGQDWFGFDTVNAVVRVCTDTTYDWQDSYYKQKHRADSLATVNEDLRNQLDIKIRYWAYYFDSTVNKPHMSYYDYGVTHNPYYQELQKKYDSLEKELINTNAIWYCNMMQNALILYDSLEKELKQCEDSSTLIIDYWGCQNSVIYWQAKYNALRDLVDIKNKTRIEYHEEDRFINKDSTVHLKIWRYYTINKCECTPIVEGRNSTGFYKLTASCYYSYIYDSSVVKKNYFAVDTTFYEKAEEQ